MRMHAPVTFSMAATVKDSAQDLVGEAKAVLPNPGRFPSPEDQLAAYGTVLRKAAESGFEPVSKREFLEELFGSPVAMGARDFVPYVGGVSDVEGEMHAPMQLTMFVCFTDGHRTAVVELGMNYPGFFRNAADFQKQLNEIPESSLPKGFRLMTKREFFDHLVREKTGQSVNLAMPGADEFEPLV